MRGSGTVVTEAREVGDFDAVDLRGPCELVLHPAARAGKVILRGDDNLLPLVEAVVRAEGTRRMLEIGLRRGVHIELAIGGSGNVVLDGRVRRLQLSIAGHGQVDGSDLRADEVEVGIAGVGAAQVHAQQSLRVSIGGMGQVSYRGDPRVSTSISGVGQVGRG